jgi:hypothetical protein
MKHFADVVNLAFDPGGSFVKHGQAGELVLPTGEEADVAIVAAFAAGGRMMYAGAGTSGRLGVRIAASLTGRDPETAAPALARCAWNVRDARRLLGFAEEPTTDSSRSAPNP